jgi:hypothetical protein
MDTKGTHYLIGFAIGSSLVPLTFWIIRYWYKRLQVQIDGQAYSNLPSFYIHCVASWRAFRDSVGIGNFLV